MHSELLRLYLLQHQRQFPHLKMGMLGSFLSCATVYIPLCMSIKSAVRGCKKGFGRQRSCSVHGTDELLEKMLVYLTPTGQFHKSHQ